MIWLRSLGKANCGPGSSDFFCMLAPAWTSDSAPLRLRERCKTVLTAPLHPISLPRAGAKVGGRVRAMKRLSTP